jgi:GT2 family glycosyltransferase
MPKLTDIIIPLYNGYDFFKECFESVLSNTDAKSYRLILVNDCSTEVALLDYLKDIEAKKLENVLVLHNKENLGFIGSVNNGMSQSKDNDVLLLNSDTVVTKNWLDKIIKCAYSRNNIGTVTPFSNNATLVSFPNQWKDNNFPAHQDAESLNSLIEKSSLKLYPEIPSPVGFCMFIKREILKKAGFFDRIYGKGYGEENDFGMRAYRLGYKHVLDDTTFIHHKGSLSFDTIKEEKKKLIEKNSITLHSRYPELNELLLTFDKEKTLLPVYENIKINLETLNLSKKGILFVSVADPEEHITGALLHIQHLIKNVSDDYNKYVIFKQENKLKLILYSNEFDKIQFDFPFYEKFSIENFHHEEIESIWEFILSKFNIDIVHFQTPQDLPLSLFPLSKKLGKIVYYTAHDFFLYCPTFILTRYNKKSEKEIFCNFESDPNICNECIKYKMGINNLSLDFMHKRKAFIKNEIIPAIDKLFCPSAFLKENLVKLFPNQIHPEKCFIIEHGLDKANDKKPAESTAKLADSKINVAFLGNFSEIKGAKIFAQLVKNLSAENNLHFYIIGSIGDEQTLNTLKPYKKLTIIGEYTNSNLEQILTENNIHVTLLLSICPETFSFTLSESWYYKLPAIALELGSLGQRISQNNAGWIINPENPVMEITSLLKDILKNPAILSEKIKNIPLSKTAKENAKEFEEYYNKNDFSEIHHENLSSKKVFAHLSSLENGQHKFHIDLSVQKNQPAEKDSIIQLDGSKIKHYAYETLNKIGLAKAAKPIYDKHKHTLQKIIFPFSK